MRFLVLLIIGLVCMQANAGTILSSQLQVNAVSSMDGTSNGPDATHGFFVGNIDSGNTTPLLTLLNHGTSGDPVEMFSSPGNGDRKINISSGGMFSTTNSYADFQNDGDIVDSIQGVVISRTHDWELIGNSATNETDYPFQQFVFNATPPNEMLLRNDVAPLNGTYALAIKASTGYAVYAWQDLVNVDKFTFDLDVNDDFDWGASNVSLYRAGPSTNVVPEPSSLAIFAVAGAFLGIPIIRRRRR